MHFRPVAFATGIAVIFALSQGPMAAQSINAKPAPAKSEAKTWKAPRTVEGQPDLQGVWANNIATPLQRPKELEGHPVLTDQEVAAMKRKAAELFNGQSDAAFADSVFLAVWQNLQGTKKGYVSQDGQTGDYSSVWTVQRDWDNRTSLITDPADGKIPEMTSAAKQKRVAQGDEGRIFDRRPNGPEDLSLSVRCITFGSPSFFGGYNSYYQIFQSKNSVAIVMEKIHDARIIPLDGSPHPPSTVHEWMGDSRGHWEGDTLVVDSTNYKAGAFMNSSDKLHVIERFTRSGPESLKYEVTIDDPETWTKPWSVMIPLKHTNEAMYEYACHEGNYGMVGILSGARAEEKKEQASK